MRKLSTALLPVILVLLVVTSSFSQEPAPSVSVAPNAPKDKPVDATAEQARKIEEAIRPYIEMAKKSYPEARDRFLRGLPPKHSFFVTTRLTDSTGKFEQVFIAVREIKQRLITGQIWSEIHLVPGYKAGDTYSFSEDAVIDWTITRPDGTEEGNFVGKFLDSYQPEEAESETWRETPATPAKMNQRIDEAANKNQASAPIPLIALYDIGYPRDAKEHADLDAQAVLLLTVLVQSQAELPIKRAYVVLGGHEIELRKLKQMLSKQNPSNNVAAKTFGAYREDSLYLLPMYLRTKTSDLMVDLTQNRQKVKVATFGTPLPPEVSALPAKTPTGINIQTALDLFLKREFPSFFQ